ncbi:tRNA (adenosine(37)-N6)-threonylcarbamoyltransferase complex dimerization subunit type 1 TsaB [bacterium]|nr:MAG: tRNA (adenosine(37)-N6)-threonylcarbamoyltransferase complex dimerization subunit type 1 TsaB [bacterium]
MKILGIDTSTRFLSIGLWDKNKIYSFNLELGPKLANLITPTIEMILDALSWKIGDIDYFACGLGPGSFTGLRVGLATIKGLAWSIDRPIVGISSLDILARNVGASSSTIVPVVDAKRSLIYCSAYKINGSYLKRIMPYQLLTKDELIRKLKGNVLLLGDALDLYKQDLLDQGKKITVLDRDLWYPQPHNIILAALQEMKVKKITNSFDIAPIYLYPKECQIKNSYRPPVNS